MSNRSSWVPAGWGFEPDDPSVGIFGEYIWHDDCPSVPTVTVRYSYGDQEIEEATDPVILEQFLAYKGNGINRMSEWAVTWICLDCGERVSFINEEWDPDDYAPPTFGGEHG